ncbi:MAG: hypothetical protein KME33_07515 [Aetokthonos hydrillicola CCALA 1050]|nr:hypothetical protein [Aetokthonos hydrillicola CCALA 1050]
MANGQWAWGMGHGAWGMGDYTNYCSPADASRLKSGNPPTALAPLLPFTL